MKKLKDKFERLFDRTGYQLAFGLIFFILANFMGGKASYIPDVVQALYVLPLLALWALYCKLTTKVNKAKREAETEKRLAEVYHNQYLLAHSALINRRHTKSETK